MTNKKAWVLAVIASILINVVTCTSGKAQSLIIGAGVGMEFKGGAKPVQPFVGISAGRSELTAGYTTYFSANDNKYPTTMYLKYGLNLLNDDLEFYPVIGAGYSTRHLNKFTETEESYNDAEINPLYGIKLQKQIFDRGNGSTAAMFLSVEHCRLNYALIGLQIKF